MYVFGTRIGHRCPVFGLRRQTQTGTGYQVSGAGYPTPGTRYPGTGYL